MIDSPGAGTPGLDTGAPFLAVDQGDDLGIRVRMLGPVGATVAGEEIDLGGPKERAVLALLAADPAAASSADRLIDALWGESPPKSAKKTLQTYVSHLRRAFAAAGAGEVIVTGPAGYGLSSIARTDVEEVEALMASALRRHSGLDAPARVGVLSDALGRFTGSPLRATAPSVPLQALAESYVQLRWNLVEELATARLAQSDDTALTMDLHAWVDENPYRERLWGHLMLALYRAGRQAEALAAFQRARRHLTEGLGIEPGPELRDLEAAILAHDPDLLGAPSKTGRVPETVSETLTFLFTDIEQSTVRWDLEPEHMREALFVHDEILNACIESVGGRVFAAAGDGFGAAFTSPSAAARAAAAAQTRLRSTTWPTSEPLRARMGLHTGTAENRGGDFFGVVVNRAARVMDAGHGGQILCSAATAALLFDDADWGDRIRYIAECQLKGLERPERVHQLDADDTDRGFPPPRTANTARRALPAPLDSLHGRDEELAELSSILADHRLVTLTGVGGTGKTRLALELAGRVREAFPDGVLWLELAAVDGDGIVGAAARALGLTLTGDADSHRNQIAAGLREERALLVLDNCEHLLGVAAENTEAVLRGCPGVSVLTTSREPLGVPGERIYVVPSLGLPDTTGVSASEEMLRARAANAGAVIADDEKTAESVRQICLRVDGVPLALEFAAAQLSTFTASVLIEHLDEHFRLLGRPGRGGVPRQQTIESTIEWSYRLLDDAEQMVLNRLAVFHDGFELDAVEQVAGSDARAGEAASILDRLRWKSMVTVTSTAGDPVTRFKLLEPVRQFAHARLRLGDDHAAILERHAGYFAAVFDRPADGDRFANDEQRDATAQRNRANLLLALTTLSRSDLTAALRLFDALRTVFVVDLKLAFDTLSVIAPLMPSLPPDIDPIDVGNACNTIALIEGFAMQPTALDWAARALEIATDVGDQTLLAESEFHLGALWTLAGFGPQGEQHLRRSSDLHDSLGNEATLSYNLCYYAWALTLQNRVDEASPPARRGLELSWKHGTGLALNTGLAATILARAGHHDEAAQALDRIRATGNHGATSWGAEAALIIGRLDLAVDELRGYLQLIARTASRDAPIEVTAMAICDELGEADLAAIWAATTIGRDRRLRSQDTYAPELPDLADRAGLGPAVDLDTRLANARDRLGPRFDELVSHYQTSDDPGPIRETIAMLDTHAADLENQRNGVSVC